MTSLWGRGRLHKKRNPKGPSESSFPPEFSYDETLANPPAIEPPVAKYTEKDLQKIFRTVLKARVPPSDGAYQKLLKARSPDVYCGKFHIESYNFS